MADYIQKGSGNPVSGSGTVHETFTDAAKQVPGPHPDNYYDRFGSPSAFSMSKSPTFVQVVSDVGAGLGFFFGSSASYASKATTEGGATLTGSAHYISFDTLAAGQYHLNPIAVSGSDTDVAKIKLIYKGGLDGLGRP